MSSIVETDNGESASVSGEQPETLNETTKDDEALLQSFTEETCEDPDLMAIAKAQEGAKCKILHESPKKRYICYNDVVGRGAYKIVYRGYDTHLGKEVAWCHVSLHHLNETEIKAIIAEINILKAVSPQNKYLLDFFNAWADSDFSSVVIITELALSGTLKEFIGKIEHIKMRVIKKWCNQILEAIAFLHEKNIVHRDLKCNNIFINSNTGDVIIGDFGLAKQKVSNLRSIIGTPEYMAPEMFDGLYNEKVDIYSFGMCLMEMITKEIPYGDCQGIGQVYKNIMNGVKPTCFEKIKNPKAKEIIKACLENDHNKRPSATDLLQNPFFCIIDENVDDDDELTVSPPDLSEKEIAIVSNIAPTVATEVTTPVSIGFHEQIEQIDPIEQYIDMNMKKFLIDIRRSKSLGELYGDEQ